ncbi:recombinase family protein [Microbacterium sp. NPDC097977]|uniref:recombinase family protein n=1 Tax=Microbacterium sp. NPDC097977 TaxID=3155686 RepID=UPI00332B4144
MDTLADRTTKALLYVRVSTEEQADLGASLEAQEQALMVEAVRRGYDFEVVREEGKSAKSIQGRDKLVEALDLLDKHKADVLMAVRMDRLSRDVGDVAALMRRSKKKGWGIILSGERIDTTPDGEFRTHLDAALAQRERGMIGLRTREGMAQRKAEGKHMGRSVEVEFLPTYRRVLSMSADGMSLNAIARSLNEEGVPTAKGGKWYPSTVRAIVNSQTAKALSQ